MSKDDQAGTRGLNYNWEIEANHYRAECEKLRTLLGKLESSAEKAQDERDGALDALTVTQEEWFLRVKYLEIQNYDLKQAAQYAYLHLESMDNYSLVHGARYALENALKGNKK